MEEACHPLVDCDKSIQVNSANDLNMDPELLANSTGEPAQETGSDAIRSNLNDLSQLRQRFRNLIGEELEQLDEKWQHLAKDSKEKVDQLVNCAYSKKENAEKIVLKAVSDVCWNVRHFKELPHWLQENDYLLFGHRPELGSFKSCVKSMFKLHTGKRSGHFCKFKGFEYFESSRTREPSSPLLKQLLK